jgi:transcriptional regulator with XRE-family HTH domain
MASLGKEIGRVLRRARESRGLTLRQASNVSGGRFPPTSLASYERGERAISVERFCRLAAVYRIPPERLLAEVSRTAEGRPQPIVRVAELERLAVPEAQIVSSFVREVARLRGQPPADVIALRNGDLEVLASASGRRADELLEPIRPALEDSGARSE